MIDPSTLKVGDTIYFRYSDGTLGHEFFVGIKNERILLNDRFFGISADRIVSVNEDPMLDEKMHNMSFYNSLPDYPRNPEEKHCEIQWKENGPWVAATATLSIREEMICVTSMNSKRYHVCLDGTSFPVSSQDQTLG